MRHGGGGGSQGGERPTDRRTSCHPSSPTTSKLAMATFCLCGYSPILAHVWTIHHRRSPVAASCAGTWVRPVARRADGPGIEFGSPMRRRYLSAAAGSLPYACNSVTSYLRISGKSSITPGSPARLGLAHDDFLSLRPAPVTRHAPHDQPCPACPCPLPLLAD